MKKNPPDEKLIGQYFHSIKDDRVLWQGVVVGRPEPGIYQVQLMEWLMGEPSLVRLVRIEDMMDWYFYPTHEMFTHSAEHGAAKKKLPSGLLESAP